MSPDAQTALHEAIAHHREGRLEQAAVSYHRVLTFIPHHPQATLLLGMIYLDTAQDDRAQALFEEHLSVDPQQQGVMAHHLGRLAQKASDHAKALEYLGQAHHGQSDLAPLHNDLAVSLLALGRAEAALGHLDLSLALKFNQGVSHFNRGQALFALGRYLDAAQAYFIALDHTSEAQIEDRVEIWLNLSYAAQEALEIVTALRACTAILALNPQHKAAQEQLKRLLALEERLQDGQAVDLLNAQARQQGIKKMGQIHKPQAKVLLLGAVGAEQIPLRYVLDQERFALRLLSLVSPDQPDAPWGTADPKQLAEVDLVFNLLGEVDKQGGQFVAAEQVCHQLGKPVLNPIASVSKTGRDQAPILFAGIDGLVVPGVRPMERDALSRAQVSHPVLVRPGGAHGGRNVVLIHDQTQIAPYLEAVSEAQFLLTDFYDFKSQDGLYRKYRLIFIDRQPYPYHLAIGDHWMVHYHRTHMELSAEKRQEEERFLLHWQDVFGPRATKTIEAVAQALDLDYGGMDCALLPDGQVLLFEANACMLVHLEDSALDFPYKHVAVPCIREAMSQLILKSIAV